MKKSRFTEAQMGRMLREADKTSVAGVSKKYGVRDQTIYNWRQHFGGMDAAEVLAPETAGTGIDTTSLAIWTQLHLRERSSFLRKIADLHYY